MNTAMTHHLMECLERIVNDADKDKLQRIRAVIINLSGLTDNVKDKESIDEVTPKMLTDKIREIGKHFADTVTFIKSHCKGNLNETMSAVLDSCDAFVNSLDSIVAEFNDVGIDTEEHEGADIVEDIEYQDRLKRCIAASADLEGQIRSAKRLLSGDDNTGKCNKKIIHRNGDGVCFVTDIDDDNDCFNQLLSRWLKQVRAVANSSARRTLDIEQ